MNMLKIAVFALSFLFALPLSAQVDLRERITVTGAAEVKAVPNEFILNATIETFDKELDEAAQENDKVIARISKHIRALGVDRRYVVTDDVRVTAVTEGYRERRNFKRVGFKVYRNVMVILHDPKKIERAMGVLFDAGVDSLSMNTGHTDIDELTAEAEHKAVAAARAKAGRMTGALGRRLGNAVTISETSTSGATRSNFVYGASTPQLGDSLSLGKLNITAAVDVTFLMTD